MNRFAAIAVLSLAPFLAAPLPPRHSSQNTAASPPLSLDALLAKAAAYCRRLEGSAFDLACREEISETVDPSLDAAAELPPSNPYRTTYSGPTITISKVKKIKHRFVYDYQCVRTARVLREMRTQLEENGKRKVVSNAGLRTPVVDFAGALLSPIGLFGERSQPGYDFSVASEAKAGDTGVLVIDAKPKPEAPLTRYLYGKAWIDPATGVLLKIEWGERPAGRFEIFETRGRLYNREPRLVFSSEFGAEKNGIRFPSRLSFEESFLNDAGKVFVRSRSVAVYKDFKLLSVEVELRD